jgi:hypothetical protein
MDAAVDGRLRRVAYDKARRCFCNENECKFKLVDEDVTGK